jgi:hypothetical protein
MAVRLVKKFRLLCSRGLINVLQGPASASCPETDQLPLQSDTLYVLI